MRLWTWDIETLDWDKPLCAVATSEEGDVARFWGSDCLEKMRDHMRATKGTYVAHYGGGFDVPLLLNVHKFRKIILTGSNILCAEDSRDLKLRDSYPWFLASLAKIGKAVGLEKSPDVDRTNLGAHAQSEILDYCERDCEVLLRGVHSAQSFLREHDAQQAWTAGASAVSLLRALEPGTWKALQAHRVREGMLRESLRAVRGGRVECTARGRVEGVYSYDFKSSYPARYATRPLCAGVRRATKRDQVGVWRCRWHWPHRDRIPPALDSATMCGVGTCEGWLIDEEIALFEECGVKVHRHEGFAPETILDIGHVFLETMFAAKEGGGPYSAFAKVWGNALHGKLCEDPVKEHFTAWRPSKYLVDRGLNFQGHWWRYSDTSIGEDGKAAAHAQPVAGALILGRARAALNRVQRKLQEAGWELYYCDTDSVMTNCPPEKMPVPLGLKLGDLAYEAGPCEGWFLGPKAYLLIDEKGAICKSALKGVPLKHYQEGIFEGGAYRQALRARPGREAEKGTDLRLEVFRRALKEGARCEKQGISSFLVGLGEGELWGAHSVTRTIKPSGRGKVFNVSNGRDWAYLTTEESIALDVARKLPMGLKRWAKTPLVARRFLYDENRFVNVLDNRVRLSSDGMLWMEAFREGNLASEIEDSADDD